MYAPGRSLPHDTSYAIAVKKYNLGFTFVELMVVISIAAILFSIASVTYTNVTKNSRDARRKVDMESIRQALELYRSSDGLYPAGIYNDCSSLTGRAGDMGICTTTKLYLRSTPLDPKSKTVPYIYACSGTPCSAYTLSSALMEDTKNCDDPAAVSPCTKTVYNP